MSQQHGLDGNKDEAMTTNRRRLAQSSYEQRRTVDGSSIDDDSDEIEINEENETHIDWYFRSGSMQ